MGDDMIAYSVNVYLLFIGRHGEDDTDDGVTMGDRIQGLVLVVCQIYAAGQKSSQSHVVPHRPADCHFESLQQI